MICFKYNIFTKKKGCLFRDSLVKGRNKMIIINNVCDQFVGELNFSLEPANNHVAEQSANDTA